MSEEIVNRVYAYLKTYGKFGAHPHQLAKALNLDEPTVMSALKELEKQGKIRLRSANIEWKFKRRLKRTQ